MAELYNKPLKKTDDWGGVINSVGKRLPASGKVVQAFIKNSLQKRIGYIYEDKVNKKYIGFADTEDFEAYYNDSPDNPNFHNDELIIEQWDSSNLDELLLGDYYQVPSGKKIVTKYKELEIKNPQTGEIETVYIAVGVLEDAVPCTINFFSKNTLIDTITASEGSSIIMITPQIDRVEFEGWYMNPSYIGVKYNAGSSYTILGDVNFYAKWAINNEYLLVGESQLNNLGNNINYNVLLEEECNLEDLEGWSNWSQLNETQYIVLPKKDTCNIEDYVEIDDVLGGNLTPGFVMNCPENKSYVTIRWRRDSRIDWSDALSKIKFKI